ncbi:MAG TPA: sigma-54 dependent transcriptional regulator [Chitinispirillaceae bacterium]|nr:sigma-54 dependent transcriptional regulator [Chitinispirillaceae bacterium]
MNTLLIVDDNNGLREQMKWAFSSDYTVYEAGDSNECMRLVEQYKPQIVLLDMGLDNIPDKGLELIDLIIEIERTTKIVVITANTSDLLGPESVRRGAFDYLVKPVDIDNLLVVVERALRIKALEKIDIGSAKNEGKLQIESNIFMIGASEPVLRIFELIPRIAETDVNVLITGESGTGKDLCARAIHYHSKRCNGAFVPINCGAIPENLIESELFGYVKGAFTGANTDKTGLLEIAHEGTLLLDEIGEMPKNLQVRLLRFLEDQKVQRLGGTELRKVDVRVVAATNAIDITNQSSQRGLRNDLFYRLSEFQIDVPPLRNRGNDILLIANSVVERYRTKFGLNKLSLSLRAENALLHYSWPGNVRELENKLSRAAITCVNQIIEPEDLLLSASSATDLTLKEARDVFEREFLINVLRQVNFNISDAARIAGVSRPTIYDLLKKHSITLDKETTIKDN